MKFDLKIAFQECANPQAWAYMATVLQKVASPLDWTENRDFTDWRYIPVYRMLMGLSLENLLKGILVAEGLDAVVGEELNPALGAHSLQKLAEKVKGLTITEFEKRVLSELEPYVLWAGRYPTPKREPETVRIGHSRKMHDAELELAIKCYNYLRSLDPQIEPDAVLVQRLRQVSG